MLTTLLFTLVLSSAPPELKAKFAHALELYERGESARALSEFEAIYAQYPKPVVLFNIGLVQAARGDALASASALEKVLADPGDLKPERVEKAQAVLAEQLQKLGTLSVETNASGAEIDVDGRPLGKPGRVRAGTRVVTALAAGFSPARKEVEVPAGGEVSVSLTLEPLQKKLAQLKLKSPVPGAAVFIDSQRAGTTPLTSTLALTPGEHRVEVRREGYVTWASPLKVDEGAEAELTASLEEEMPIANAGRVALRTSEPTPTLTVDGRTKGLYVAPVPLVPGPHVVVVEHGGFYPVQREVDVAPDTQLELEVVFEPTPETLAQLESSHTVHRGLGLAGLGVGGAAVIGGAVFYYLNASARPGLDADYRQTIVARDRDPRCTTARDNACEVEVGAALDKLNANSDQSVAAIVILAAGGVLTAGGIIALLTAPDVGRYRPKTGLELDGLSFTFTPSGGSVGLSGRF